MGEWGEFEFVEKERTRRKGSTGDGDLVMRCPAEVFRLALRFPPSGPLKTVGKSAFCEILGDCDTSYKPQYWV
jgi:hypothetical protein